MRTNRYKKLTRLFQRIHTVLLYAIQDCIYRLCGFMTIFSHKKVLSTRLVKTILSAMFRVLFVPREILLVSNY